MRRRWSAWFLVSVLVASGLVFGVGAASAHQCPDDAPPGDPECHETPVYEDWRSNVIPLFDLPDREEQEPGSDGEQQRRDAQRWREECADGDQYRQQCAWAYGGQSVTEYDTDENGPRPNELHAGYAANHCFLAEGAHDCDGHDETEFGTHDSHGGAVYADVCLAPNPDSKYCDDGVEDTQVGVTVVDHLDCPMGCMDEYHVVRPADTAYTTEQMEDSQAAVERIATDPKTQLCGYPDHSVCP